MKTLFFDDETLTGITEYTLSSLIGFIRHVWDPATTQEKYLKERQQVFRENPYARDEGFPLGILLDGERVIGHVVSVPCRIWSHGIESPLYWNAGLHILEEYRGKRLGMVLPKLTTEKLSTITAFFVIEQQLKTHTKLGFTIPGKINDYIKILNVKNVAMKLDIGKMNQIPGIMRTLLGPPGSFMRMPVSYGLSAVYGFYKLRGKPRKNEHMAGCSMKFVDTFDERVDLLWNRVKYSISCAQVRNSAYMNWQFNTRSGWMKVVAERRGELLGYALCSGRVFEKGEKLSGLKVLSIIDMLWDFEKPDVLAGMLHWIENYAREGGCDAVICSVNHIQTEKILRRKSFFKLPGTAYFIFYTQNKSLRLSPDMRDWFLTRGDADAAGSLGPAKVPGTLQ